VPSIAFFGRRLIRPRPDCGSDFGPPPKGGGRRAGVPL